MLYEIFHWAVVGFGFAIGMWVCNLLLGLIRRG